MGRVGRHAGTRGTLDDYEPVSRAGFIEEALEEQVTVAVAA